jgi:hypothetical protein
LPLVSPHSNHVRGHDDVSIRHFAGAVVSIDAPVDTPSLAHSEFWLVQWQESFALPMLVVKRAVFCRRLDLLQLIFIRRRSVFLYWMPWLETIVVVG